MDFISNITDFIYPDIIADICIPLIMAIFTFALPLLLSAAERIDDKYKSVLLIKLFRKDRCCRYFLACLLFSIIAVVIYSLNMPRLINCGILNSLIDNSAIILLLFATLSLIAATFCVVWLIYKYNI